MDHRCGKCKRGTKRLSVTDTVIILTNNTIKSSEVSEAFRISESGLGTGATLRYSTGIGKDKFVDLSKGEPSALVFVRAFKADESGSAYLPITASGTYKIVISDEAKLVEDLNNSMDINALDAAIMLKKLVDGNILTKNVAKFDFNGDGNANALDVAAVLRYIVSESK